MKSIGVWVALGVLCTGLAGAAASCSGDWSILSPPTFEEAKADRDTTGTNGAGGAGTGGTGGEDGGSGGCGCNPMPCQIGNCVNGGCEYSTNPQANGTFCSEDMSKVCSNGNCRLAPGQLCASELDCASGSCADGVCCDGPCDEKCKACNIPGKLGKCDFLPKGWPEDACPNEACSGTDINCIGGNALGKQCDNGGNCASGKCLRKSCRLPDGEPCSDPVQCASNFCDAMTNKCAVADPTDLCKSKVQSSMVCLAAPGEPCGKGTDCAMPAICNGNICQVADGEVCANYNECINRVCNNSGMCSSCASVDDCNGEMCSGLLCPLGFPEGAYCNDSIGCIKGFECVGFPRKCTNLMQ
jgi:hypothetical protein